MMTQNSSAEMMMQILLSFIRAKTWSEKKAYLAEHPELLTASSALSRLIEQEENQDIIRILTQHRDLLAEARQKGLDEAFAELMPTPTAGTNPLLPLLDACDSPTALLQLAAQQPQQLSDEVDALLQQRIGDAHAEGSDEGKTFAQDVAARHETLRQLRQMMDETGMSAEELVEAVRAEQESPPQQVIDAALAFLNAKSWGERKRIVEQERKLLLSDMALEVFADLFEQYKENEGAIGSLIDHRDLLICCRKKGIDVAFAETLRFQGTPISDEVAALWEQIQALTHVTDMPRRIELCHRALKLVTRDNHPELWAALQGKLGNSYYQNRLGERADNIEQAISCYQGSLSVHTRQALPTEWATTMNNLAAAYSGRIKGKRADNIEQAISCYQGSLSVVTRQALPLEWAETMNNLAAAYSERIKGEPADNIEQAITCFKLALEVRTRQALPVEWATTMNNFAIAYKNRIKGEHAGNIEQGINYFKLALSVRTRQACMSSIIRGKEQISEDKSDLTSDMQPRFDG